MQKRIPVLEDHSWQPPVLAIANTPTVTSTGARYLVGTSPTGAFAGQANKIAWKDDVSWHFDTPSAGWEVAVIDVDKLYHFNGTVWTSRPASGDFIKANPSSTANKIPTWDGVTGDKLNDGLELRQVIRASGIADDTGVASEKAVRDAIEAVLAAADAMVFIGTVNAAGLISAPKYPDVNGKYFGSGATGTKITDYSAGWTFKASAEIPTTVSGFGKKLEQGDMIIAINDFDSAFDIADFSGIQTNIDGAVTGPASATDGHVAIFDGTTGKVIKDSGLKLSDITEHLNDDDIHFTEDSIDHDNIQNIGTYKHAGIDAHIGTQSIHRQTNYVSSLKCIVWDDSAVLPSETN